MQEKALKKTFVKLKDSVERMECKIKDLSQYAEQDGNKVKTEKINTEGQSRSLNNQLTEVPELQTSGNRAEGTIT